jgi:membrane associated rhomboid family serine protease
MGKTPITASKIRNLHNNFSLINTMTLYILIITVIISIIAFSNNILMDKFIFNPYAVNHYNQWYRFFSSGFIHADWLHLIINMYVLYSFGNAVESFYGQIFGDIKGEYYFFLLYLGGLLIAVLPTYAKHKNSPHYNALGASGAVSAVVFSSIILSPWTKLYLYGIIGLPAIVFGVAYLGYSYYMDKKGGDQVNHNAHFWGAIFGIIYTIALKPALLGYFFNQIISLGNN